MKTRDKILDGIDSFICIIFPLTTIPQIKKIWMKQNAEGISLLTWVLYLVFTIPLIAYAIKKNDLKLAVMWAIWAFIYILVITGTVYYQ